MKKKKVVLFLEQHQQQRRGYGTTKYSGRVVTETDNGRSFAVKVQLPANNPTIQLDPRGYPLPRRDLICKVVNILLNNSISQDPFTDLTEYLQTFTHSPLTVSEASEILKSISSTPTLALQFFKYCPSSIPKFRHDAFTYNRILLILSNFSSPDRFDSVRRIVNDMERSRVRGNISTVNLLIGIFGNEEIDLCLRLVRQWELKMNRYTYKCLLQAHLRAHDSTKGLQVYQDMTRKGYYPDIFAYNMLLDALAKDQKEAYGGWSSGFIWMLVFHSAQREVRERHHYTVDCIVAIYVGFMLWKMTGFLWPIKNTSRKARLNKLEKIEGKLYQAAKDSDLEQVRDLLKQVDDSSNQKKNQAGREKAMQFFAGGTIIFALTVVVLAFVLTSDG